MKTSVCVLFVSLAVSFTGTANAAVGSTSSSTSTLELNYADMLYDYEVYWGEPRFRWYIVWDMGNSNTIEYGSFLTEQEAFDFLAKCFFAGWEPEGYVGYEIVKREIEPLMTYLATYDKKADVLELANIVESLGFYVEIRKIGFDSLLSR